MRFEAAKCALRAVRDEDHPWLVELHNDPAVLWNTRDPRPITLDAHLAWWQKICADPREERLIFTVDDAPAGIVKIYSIDAQNLHCTLGADLHRSFRGRGLAGSMWSLLLDRCFFEHGLNRVGISTMEQNAPARRVYSRLGFIEEGRIVHCHLRDGEFLDAITLYMLRKDWLEQEIER
jgi:RimJ/RimL family protein N-acetyltransferase